MAKNNENKAKQESKDLRSFSFYIDLNANDLWTFYMYNANKGYRLAFNIVFTIGCIAYLIYYWNDMDNARKVIMLIFALMFTLIQPALLYRKAVLQAKKDNMKAGFKLTLSDSGIDASQAEQKLHLDWEQIYRSMVRKYMIVLYTDSIRGYLIPARHFSDKRAEIIALLKEKTKLIGF